MPKSNLCQIIAVATGKKNEVKNDLTKLYQGLSKEDLLKGLVRTYQPIDEEGEKFPDESKMVQVRVQDVLDKARKLQTELFDVVVTQDVGNTIAKADVEVDGVTVLKDVPVTSLLFLEKHLTDLHSIVGALPCVPQESNWRWDDNRGVYVSDVVQTAKTNKIPFPLVKYEATKEHPAQVEVVHKDKVVGYWSKTEFSGALSVKEKLEYINRVRKLREAVVRAREKANQVSVDHQSVGKAIFDYLLAPI